MRTLIYHLCRVKAHEIGKLMLIWSLSLLAAISGYTAVSWIHNGVSNKVILFLTATAVTFIFCGIVGVALILFRAESGKF